MREKQAAAMKDRGFITAKEAADRAGVSITAVYQWLDDAKVRGARVGRARYVQETSLNDYIGEHL